MKRVWQTPATVLAGLLVTAMYAKPQAYTVSARPGGINYIEGQAYLDGRALSDEGLKSVFLNANDTLSTSTGKAEILLTPGVFLRIGDNSQIRMISPSLTDTQVEVNRGEAMIEADGLLKDNNIQVIDHGGSITIERNGLYRFSADNPPTAAVLEGKAQVYFGDKKIDLGKGHETVLSDVLKPEKFDSKKQDDLYAWSNVRSEYDAATSYQTAKNMSINSYDAFGGFGFGAGFVPGFGPGWYWDNAFDSWGWMPGEGAFFSPFGYGFYGGGYLPYAPVVVAPVYGRGGWHNGHWTGTGGRTAPVPVNPTHPPAVGATASSPWANHVMRAQAAQAFAARGGFRTATGAPAASFSGNRTGSFSGGHAGWSGGGAHAAYSGGGGGGGHFSGGAAGGGGGHVGGGGGGGGHR